MFGCLFLNNNKLKCLNYYGCVFSFKINNNNKNNKIFGKFKITNKTKIFAKNIPMQNILICQNYCIINYSITAELAANKLFYLYICNNLNAFNITDINKLTIKKINLKIIKYYKNLFSLKIVSKNKIIQNLFNNILPKLILTNCQKINYKNVYTNKCFSENKLLEKFLNNQISEIDFYLLLKLFAFGVSETKNKITLAPKSTNIQFIIFKNLKVKVENSNTQKHCLKINNVAYYNMNTINKSLNLSNSQITLVI